MEFIIGLIYDFDYESKSQKPKDEDVQLVKLTPSSISHLKKSLVKNSEQSKVKLIEQKIYVSKVQKFEKFVETAKSVEGSRRANKMPEVIHAKEEIVNLKADYRAKWGKSDYKPTDEEKATHQFFRNYSEESIKLKTDGKIKAMFVGESYTVNCKQQLKFVNLEWTRIKKKYVSEHFKYLETKE